MDSTVLCLVTQSCLTLCNPMDCSPAGSSVHGILLARILEWVVMPSSRGSSQPRDQTRVYHIAGGFFTIWTTRAYIHIQNVLAIILPQSWCSISIIISYVVIKRKLRAVQETTWPFVSDAHKAKSGWWGVSSSSSGSDRPWDAEGITKATLLCIIFSVDKWSLFFQFLGWLECNP